MNRDIDIVSLLIINQIEGLGLMGASGLVDYFGGAGAAVRAGPSEWPVVVHDTVLCEKIRSDWDRLCGEGEKEWERCQKMRIQIWGRDNELYPPLLKEIRVPPLVLYAKGGLKTPLDSLAIVGSRRSSYYGGRVARMLARDLAERQLVTVSGLARGIDTVVHDETIKSGGQTIAVVGCGLDACYPPENKGLMERIADTGVVLSEFPLGTTPRPGHFPRRNRIIAGLTYGTVVVEGTIKSGSLITARIAASEGRDVYAVPGPVTSPLSEAPNLLIKQGAILVETVDDLIANLPEPVRVRFEPQKGAGPNQLEFPGPAGEILNCLSVDVLTRDALVERSGLPTEKVTEMLIKLELEGRVQSLPGGLVVRL